MKLIEATIYGGVGFTGVYVILAFILRIFHFTTDYNSHMIAGIVGTVIGIIIFLLVLRRKKDTKKTTE